MEIKKFNFRDFKTLKSILDQELTLGEYIAASELVDVPKQEPIPQVDLSNYILKEESSKLCNEFFEQGRIEGLKFIEDQTKMKETEMIQQNNLLLEKILSTLQSIEFHDSTQAFNNDLQHIQELTITIAKKIASKAMNENFTLVIEEVINKYLSELKSNKKIILKINPYFDFLQETLKAKFFNKFQADFEIIFDDNLSLYDVEIEWDNGLIQRNTDEIISNIESILTFSPESNKKFS